MAIDLLYDNVNQFADLVQNSLGTIQIDEGLEPAVLISLFSDRRAVLSEIADPQDRRGWWGDTFADVAGDQIGSKLWLLARAKNTPDTLRKAKRFAEEALAWLLEDGVASTVTATAFFETRHPAVPLFLTIEIQRPETPAVKWIRTWNVTEALTG